MCAVFCFVGFFFSFLILSASIGIYKVQTGTRPLSEVGFEEKQYFLDPSGDRRAGGKNLFEDGKNILFLLKLGSYKFAWWLSTGSRMFENVFLLKVTNFVQKNDS